MKKLHLPANREFSKLHYRKPVREDLINLKLFYEHNE